MKLAKKLLIICIDELLVAMAFTMAFLLRFEFYLPDAMRDIFWQGLCVVLLIKPLVFFGLNFYRNLWRYASLHDAVNIFKAVSISSVVTTFFFSLFLQTTPLPRSVVLLDWILLLLLISASRLAMRYYREFRHVSGNVAGYRTLIVGAGQAGSMLLKEIRKQQDSSYNIIGFVDDNRSKKGMLLNGVPVLGNQQDLSTLVKKYRIEAVIMAIPSARGIVLRSIVDHCTISGVRFKTLPAITDIIDGNVSVSQIKDVEIGDLLGREPVVLDETGIGKYVTGKRVLVTGAAGSIGSELCRQVARFNPGQLILLDHAETPLFYIERELNAAHPDLNIIPVIGDVKNWEKINAVFAENRPDAVFHAAAYKHVPMMEYNPAEAVLNNISGTRIMADAADRFGTRNFVMISTDKAVNPANVMGASKRVAEIYVQALSRKSSTKFTTVRFGNVLGSNGSVIPVFMEQIRNGGPVTVTDPDITRYFMTIPEAAQLVLQAGSIGNGGEIFVLDMGEPVRIADLARELISLSGLIPDEDIPIVYTGLRPGEKLYEELLIAGEGVMPTNHKKIMVASSVETDLESVSAELDRLFNLSAKLNTIGIMQSLQMLVPEFIPGPHYSTITPQESPHAQPGIRTGTKSRKVSGKVLPLTTRSLPNITANGTLP